MGGGSYLPVVAASSARGASFGAALAQQQRWLASQTAPDGAILYGNEVEPYYANLAAIGETSFPSALPAVRSWMSWYVNHLNAPDKWGLSGTVYDYRYDRASGTETSLDRADSVDSYAATFFTLARALYDTHDAASQQFVKTLQAPLTEMGAMLLQIRQPDGLTIALPSYRVAYLMDNAEVYRGLRDLAYLERTAFGNGAAAASYDAAASGISAALETFWSPADQRYAEEKAEPNGSLTRAQWSRWYPDATAQLFPILEGVILPNSPRSRTLWRAFNAAYPAWDQFRFPDKEPWALVGDTAAIVGDTARAQIYARSVQKRFSPAFLWPWYDMESGWYVRMLEKLQHPVSP